MGPMTPGSWDPDTLGPRDPGTPESWVPRSLGPREWLTGFSNNNIRRGRLCIDREQRHIEGKHN